MVVNEYFMGRYCNALFVGLIGGLLAFGFVVGILPFVASWYFDSIFRGCLSTLRR